MHLHSTKGVETINQGCGNNQQITLMMEIEILNHSHDGDRDLKLGAETINQPSGVETINQPI